MSGKRGNTGDAVVYHDNETKEIFYVMANPNSDKKEKSYPKRIINDDDFLAFTKKITGGKRIIV